MRRNFTPEEDELIKEQSQGKLVLSKLERLLHSCRQGVVRRAKELGVQVVVRKKAASGQSKLLQEDPIASDEEDTELLSLEDDPLLERLKSICGSRRYRSLKMKTKE